MTDPASPVSIVRQSELLSVCRATRFIGSIRDLMARVVQAFRNRVAKWGER